HYPRLSLAPLLWFQPSAPHSHLHSFPTRRSSDLAAHDADQLVFVTEAGQLLRFAAELVRPQGRSGGGIAGMKLVDNDQILSFTVAPAAQLDEAVVVTVTSADTETLDAAPTAKVTKLEEFAPKGRNTQGMRAHRLLRGELGLALAWA